MKDWPKISIVTPSYNQAAFLEQTIRSVLEQNYPNLEYIIIDGGSTDGSVDIIRKYIDKLAYWVSEKDEGHADALNKGFRRATGEIAAFLNSDDLYCPGVLKDIAETFMADKDVDFVFGNRITVDENGRTLRDDRHTRFSFAALVLYGMIVSQPATFWKRELFEKYGYFSREYFFSFDYEFFCRIGAHIKAKHIRKHLAKFRRHTTSKTCTVSDVGWKDNVRIHETYKKQVCKGWPERLVILAVFAHRTFWYVVQGDGLYVLKGVVRRMLPQTLRAQWM
jgi:glycosyltransferase involved in cell wall biosynthesis